jgi:hypothetical protein
MTEGQSDDPGRSLEDVAQDRVVAKANKGWRESWALVAIICGAMAIWCAYDGWFKKIHLGAVVSYDADAGKITVQLTKAGLEKGERIFVNVGEKEITAVVEHMEIEGAPRQKAEIRDEIVFPLPEAAPAETTVYKEYEHKTFNRISAMVSAAVAVFALFRYRYVRGFAVIADAEGVRYGRRPLVPWAQIRGIDRSEAHRGLIALVCADATRLAIRKRDLDDYDAMVAFAIAHVAEGDADTPETPFEKPEEQA